MDTGQLSAGIDRAKTFFYQRWKQEKVYTLTSNGFDWGSRQVFKISKMSKLKSWQAEKRTSWQDSKITWWLRAHIMPYGSSSKLQPTDLLTEKMLAHLKISNLWFNICKNSNEIFVVSMELYKMTLCIYVFVFVLVFVFVFVLFVYLWMDRWWEAVWITNWSQACRRQVSQQQEGIIKWREWKNTNNNSSSNNIKRCEKFDVTTPNKIVNLFFNIFIWSPIDRWFFLPIYISTWSFSVLLDFSLCLEAEPG